MKTQTGSAALMLNLEIEPPAAASAGLLQFWDRTSCFLRQCGTAAFPKQASPILSSTRCITMPLADRCLSLKEAYRSVVDIVNELNVCAANGDNLLNLSAEYSSEISKGISILCGQHKALLELHEQRYRAIQNVSQHSVPILVY